VLLVIEGGAVPIPLGEPARPVPATGRPIPEGYLRRFPSLHSRARLIPFDQQTRKELELTFPEALCLGHNYIGTERILLARLELEESEGVLSGLGIDKAAAQAHVASALTAVQAARQGP